MIRAPPTLTPAQWPMSNQLLVQRSEPMQWNVDDAKSEARKLSLLVNVTDDDTERLSALARAIEAVA